jgi:hypothetical protein
LLTLFTVCITWFIYLHVAYHFKTSNDLEVYDIDAPDKIKLEEVCNLRQPCTFPYWHSDFDALLPENAAYDDFEINVEDEDRAMIPLTVGKAKRLFTKSAHHTEQNEEFLTETMLRRIFERNDHLLRPSMVLSIRYDLLFGGENATTKLRYTNNFRNYFLVLHGAVTVKLAPPKTSKKVNEVADYVAQDFYSTVDAWNTSNVKFLDTTISKGQVLFIPAYWWHSIKLEKGACVACFYYKTVMNAVATLPAYALGIIQRQQVVQF